MGLSPPPLSTHPLITLCQADHVPAAWNSEVASFPNKDLVWPVCSSFYLYQLVKAFYLRMILRVASTNLSNIPEPSFYQCAIHTSLGSKRITFVSCPTSKHNLVNAKIATVIFSAARYLVFLFQYNYNYK